MTTTQGKPVLVTTEHRGVFYGFLPEGVTEVTLHPADSKAVTLTHARMCIYWSADVQGVLGLASHGPTSGCKITRPVPKITLTEVTAVTDVTEEAVKAWQARP
jgi:hypothetical protein